MIDAERIAEVVSAKDSPATPEQKADLDSRIAAFEMRYEMSSGTMLERIKNQQLKETAEICTWMMLLDVRRRSDQSKADPPGEKGKT